MVPIIILILLKILLDLEAIAKDVREEFEESYELTRCGRLDVYVRNIEDAILYLQSKEPTFLFSGSARDFIEDYEVCEEEGYAVYREVNEDLEILYPNWTFREAVRE